MTGFILERLCPTAWRRVGNIYWRYMDAQRAAELLLRDGEVDGVRILPVRIASQAVWESVVETSAEEDE